jgi:hypothetical protein
MLLTESIYVERQLFSSKISELSGILSSGSDRLKLVLGILENLNLGSNGLNVFTILFYKAVNSKLNTTKVALTARYFGNASARRLSPKSIICHDN